MGVAFQFNIFIQLLYGSLSHAVLITRTQSLSFMRIAPLVAYFSPTPSEKSTIRLPLVPLPTSGCLGIAVEIQGVSYLAVMDTGSPFVTAPLTFRSLTADISSLYPATMEQYGEAVGDTWWRQAQQIRFGGNLSCRKFVLGVVSDTVVEASGGIYVGLLYTDDNRPTFLQQLGYDSFLLDYKERSLELFRDRDIFSDPALAPLNMFDLTPFGPNVHHYGVLCDKLTLQTSSHALGGTTTRVCLSNTKRPIVVVIDTGLTGCILSESLREEIGSIPLEMITGAEIELQQGDKSKPPVLMASDPKYWYLSSFRLPWFTDDSVAPHIVAAGATFLKSSRLRVDAKHRRMLLEPRQRSFSGDEQEHLSRF